MSANLADAPLLSLAERDTIGTAIGKEISKFSLTELLEDGETIQANFIRSFGQYRMPMGCELLLDEIMIANMNNGTVEFHEHDGTHTMTLPNEDRSGGPVNFKEPTIATILLDESILVADKNGAHKYTSEGQHIASCQPARPGGDIYGMIPIRKDDGSILFVVQDSQHAYFRYRIYDKDLKEKLMDKPVAFGDLDVDETGWHTIRFSAGIGNTIALSDMSPAGQGIWLTDLEGRVRKRVGESKSDGDGEFIQAAGVCFDKDGNFLAICSKSSRIQAFDKEGNFLCCLQFPEGPIQRPSNLSIGDDGTMCVVSLTGQAFMFKLVAGDKNNNYATRGPRPDEGYSVIGRHRRSRRYYTYTEGGRGGPRGRGRGRGRGAARGQNRYSPLPRRNGPRRDAQQARANLPIPLIY